MTAPLISVLLPVRNAQGTITRAIDSILNQSFKDFELVIINDGSTDHTGDILKTFHDDRMRIIQTAPQGIAPALNLGISESKCDLIARMDADDFSHPDRLLKQYDFLRTHDDIDIVSCLIKHVGDDQNQKGYLEHVRWLNDCVTSEAIFHARFIDAPLAHPSVMMRKSMLTKFGGYSNTPGPEDYELWLRLLHQGIRFGKVPLTLFHWYDSPQRLSRTHQNYHQDAFFKLKAKFISLHLKKYFQKLPTLWIWGTGKSVFQKSQFLADYELDVAAYIDVVKNERKPHFKTRPIFYFEAIPDPGEIFILSYVSDRVGKKKILAYLINKGYRPGIDFYMMA
ncbi:glycosyltransferase [Fulvivirgaceae bacterium BMA10]|uniref:Glycosyltransferase n=1 Tax=Splendidivirga corallicola TaxID=3051826 RepID=A0ABT8KPZ4_9BACT|nr:glycosyltransferase [Fulvivirgaceae bacterium BMA10]